MAFYTGPPAAGKCTCRTPAQSPCDASTHVNLTEQAGGHSGASCPPAPPACGSEAQAFAVLPDSCASHNPIRRVNASDGLCCSASSGTPLLRVSCVRLATCLVRAPSSLTGVPWSLPRPSPTWPELPVGWPPSGEAGVHRLWLSSSSSFLSLPPNLISATRPALTILQEEQPPPLPVLALLSLFSLCFALECPHPYFLYSARFSLPSPGDKLP